LPQIQVWINNDDSANVEKLVKTLNDAVVGHKDKKLKAFFIFLDENGKSNAPKLAALADKLKSQDLALAYLSPKDEAIRAYKVNLDPSVKNTVMLYRQRRITSKYVNLQADEKGLAQLGSAITDLTK
jgi:hypothetical protein